MSVSSGASEFGDVAGEPATAPAIAPARSPPVEVKAQQLIAPEAVEAIPEMEFDQTVNLEAEAGHDRLVAGAGTDAEPIPELELIRRWVGTSALAEWHTQRRVGGLVPAAGGAH